MIVCLGQRVAYAIALQMLDIGIYDATVNIRVVLFQPSGQGRPHIKTYKIKVTKFCIWTITFSRYFFIVIGKGSSPCFYGEYATKGVFSRWLIKMAVNTKICRPNDTVDRHIRGFFVDHHCEHLPGLQEQHYPQHTGASCI